MFGSAWRPQVKVTHRALVTLKFTIMAPKRGAGDSKTPSGTLKPSKKAKKSEDPSKKGAKKGDTNAYPGGDVTKPTKKGEKGGGSGKKGEGKEGEFVEVKCGESYCLTAPPPTRNAHGQLVFQDAPSFRPNLTPEQVLRMGSFGGTYYRPIKSSVTGESYNQVWKELPTEWLEGLDVKKQVASPIYDTEVNKYKVKCGGSLEMWEQSGWIHKQDPYGWFMWYCRYYRGRRTDDDERQIGRWDRCAGLKGRWRNNLITKVYRAGASYDAVVVSPVVRQTLQHWGYELTKHDYDLGVKRVKK